MGPFLGAVSLRSEPLDPDFEPRVRAALASRSDVPFTVTRTSHALFFSRADQLGQDFHRSETHCIAAPRLDNRVELADALGLAPSELASLSDATLLRRMF